MSADDLPDFEQPGAFYLGRAYDSDAGEVTESPILYDSKDLCTHAVCVGMTGSGKTGLCISLIEEAALDGVPVIAIDVKGDMGNLALHFPNLAPEDFEPWVDPGEAGREGRTIEEHAKATAELWKKGLGKWGQDQDRLQRLADAADFAVYTPGSSAGLQLTVLRSFAAPPKEIAEDRELFADRVEGAVIGLLSMLGIDADPVQSRETILLSRILGNAWEEGRDLSIADMVRLVQEPPFKRLGVLDLETFFPAKERTSLALSLNGLIASPGFATWLEGEPLDIERLLHTETGKPRVSVISVAHMNDSERMFFVTVLLNEVLGWMRQQSGTGSLRALLYMDEIFGYFPPNGNPPSKKPMLTLLKQARAFGLGVVLATQNPVDLDYKGLANTGTWMIGRLQTERDKLRVLDGLEGALSSGGKGYDRGELDRLLSGLGKRVFLLHNVHEDRPVVFHTRWALNYLRGPLDRAGIERLMAPRKAALAAAAAAAAPTSAVGSDSPAAAPVAPAPPPLESQRPGLPAEIDEGFESPSDDWDGESRLLYRPHFGCIARLHYVNASAGIDRWVTHTVRAPLDEDEDVPLYDEAALVDGQRAHKTRKRPQKNAEYGPLPSGASRERTYKSWAKELEQFLYRTRPMALWKYKPFKLVSEPDESEPDFRARVAEAAREDRDKDLEKLRKTFETKRDRQQATIAKADDKLEAERDQLSSRRKDSWISMGTTLLSTIFGKKKLSATNARRAGSSASKASKVNKEKADVERAEDKLQAEREELHELEREYEAEHATLSKAITPEDFDLDDVTINPRKSDIETEDLKLVWVPVHGA